MRRTLEAGLVGLVGLACVAFVAVLARGPTTGQERTMQGAWRVWRSLWSGAGEEARALARDQALRLPRGRDGCRIEVLEGTVVVTREGDPEDHVLEAGAALELPGRGLAVAWALEPSRIEVRARARRAADRPGAPRAVSVEH